ncbi:MAG TPA: serine/threonine protein kinase, partial [Verrucomicrobiales bacterium]|nr:serine/threonine protein kinase [Verrucomicrobiales bacterium]
MKYLLIALTTTLALQAENWPMWRGAGGVGISNEKNLPLKWSTTENIAWKVALPYRG